jgi:hypothetical protein
MKHILFSTLLLFLFGCADKTTPSALVETAGEARGKTVTITGSFRSVAAVMNPLSCACAEGGYVTLENGTEEAVCFDGTTTDVTCDQITISGKRSAKMIEADDMNPCPAGEISFIQVDKFECLKDE